MSSTVLVLAWLTVVLVAGLAVTGQWWFPQVADPTWVLLAVLLAFFWGILEALQRRKRGPAVDEAVHWYRWITVWIGLVIAVAFASQLAVAAGIVEPGWAPIARRARGVIFGVGLAIAGNYLPKVLSPWRADEEPPGWQRAQRFFGWIAALCGMALVAVWLSLPVATAGNVAEVITVVFVALTLGSKLVSTTVYSRS
jgi:hypothetical protein